MSNEISIYIPTYKREVKLLNLLKSLHSDKNISKFDICVIDNDNLDSNLFEKIKQFPNVNYIKNNYNVGSSGNVIKCFEHCTTKWLWIIGDDDEIIKGGCNLVLKSITNYKDYAFINFQSSINEIHNDFIIDDISSIGLTDFAHKMPNYSNALFISSGIYNLDLIRPKMRLAYMYCYTMAPHIVMLLDSLLNYNLKCIFKKEKLVEWGPAENGNTWSYELFIMSNYDILDLLSYDVAASRVFYEKMLKCHPWPDKKTFKTAYNTWFKYIKMNIEYRLYLKSYIKTFFNMLNYIFIDFVKLLIKRPVYRVSIYQFLKSNARN
jgi:glycosyltransferase involved in cell wall biosynthesis